MRILSIWVPQLEPLNFICGGLSLAGLILWYLTRVGNIAIFFAILADGLAAVPTIVKSWYFPQTEGDCLPMQWFGCFDNAFNS